jgi:Ca-activated chloride channel family protein
MQIEFEFVNALFIFLVIPIILIIYFKHNSKNKESVLKFSSLKIIEKSTKQNKLRKHVSFAITLSILCLIIIALANPQIMTPLTVKVNNLSIVLDGSESMAATDYEPTRLEAAKKSITSIVSNMNSQNNVGIVLFETGASTISYLTPSKEKTINSISSINQGQGATAIGDGLVLGIDMVSSIPDKKRIIILLSDGIHNSGFVTPEEATTYAKNNNVKIHTVGIGSDAPVFLRDDIYGNPQFAELDEKTLEYISKETGGNYFKSLNSETLDNILSTISSDIEYEMEYSTLRHWFIGASIMLLMLEIYIIYGKYRIAV